MFYKNYNLKKSTTKAKLNFTNFSSSMNTQQDDALLPFKSAKLSYNFNVKKGSLKNGNGFKAFTLPSMTENEDRTIIPPSGVVKKIWLYKHYDESLGFYDNQILIYMDGGDIYFCPIVSDSPLCAKIMNTVFSSGTPNALNYRLNSEDAMIFTSETDGMWVYVVNNEVEAISDAPFIKSMCLHYERLFAVVGGERNRLAFSANLDPTDWDAELSAGGFIDMQDERGGLSSVISYNDYVYVFRDYGVARVSAYGDQSDFSVTQLFKSSVKLYGDTVTVCGNKIMLLAKDGIHAFDGYSTKKLDLGIDELFSGVDNDNAVGAYHNNKYYLACRLNFNDGRDVGCEASEGGYINNALIEYDLLTGEISITRGVDICSLLALDDENICKLIATFNGEHKNKIGELTDDGKFFGNVLPKMWLSPKSSMGYPTKLKHLEECLIKTKSNCKILIKTDKQEKEIQIGGRDVAQRVKLNVIGEQIQVGFVVDSDEDTEISCPQITVGITN